LGRGQAVDKPERGQQQLVQSSVWNVRFEFDPASREDVHLRFRGLLPGVHEQLGFPDTRLALNHQRLPAPESRLGQGCTDPRHLRSSAEQHELRMPWDMAANF
jgi:hypothetical protein